MTQVTAVICTYNRQDVLRRQLLYYANRPIHIVFADGSENDWGDGSSGSIGAMTWEYFRISGFDSYVKRLKNATSLVQTDFVYLLDDEECILWSGILRAIDFLRDHPDHSVAGGRVDKMVFDRRLGIRPWGYWSSNFELLEDDGVKRFELMCKRYRTANLFYQVMRKSSFQAFSDALEPDFSFTDRFPGFLETALTGYLAVSGKWKSDVYPYWLRFQSLNKNSWSGAPQFLREGEANDLGLLIHACFAKRSDTNDLGDSNMQKKLAEICEIYLGAESSKRTREKQKSSRLQTFLIKYRNKIWGNLIKLSISLWKIAPSIYELLYTGGLMRPKTYARFHEEESPSIRSEMELVEKLWSKYPKGLTGSQFEEELAQLEKSGF